MHLHAGEANKVGTETEARTLARRHADRRGDQVQNSEDRRRNERERGNLVKRKRLPGDEDGCTSNHEALNQVLDRAIDNFRDVHVFLYSS
jgi:hypothetical protein